MNPPAELLVLDVHGVVFNNPFPAFLAALAAIRKERPRSLLRRWTKHIRIPAWTGRLSEAELWMQLVGEGEPDRWRAMLEAMYEPGPAAPHLERWARSVPIWLLSNHRSEWLLPRLDRFGFAGHIQRVVVSDTVGAAKPDQAVFGPVLQSTVERLRIIVVDDHRRNLVTAKRLGFRTVHANATSSWLTAVDQTLGSARGRRITHRVCQCKFTIDSSG